MDMVTQRNNSTRVTEELYVIHLRSCILRTQAHTHTG